MRSTQHPGQFIIPVTTLALVVASVGLWNVYQVALQREKDNLTVIATRNASLVTTLAREYDREKLLTRLRQVYPTVEGRQNGRTIWIGEKPNQQLTCLIIHSQRLSTCPNMSNLPAGWASSMGKALRQKKGSSIELDAGGKKVIAAYQPLAGLPWGIAVETDLADFQAPFWQAGLMVLGTTFLGGGIGVVLCFQARRLSLNSVEKDLFKSEAQFRAIFEKSNLGMAILDREGKILDSNHELQYSLHCSQDDLKHQNFQDFLQPSSRKDFQKNYQAMVLDHRNYFQAEICCISEDQQVIEVQLVVSVVRDKQGLFDFAVAMLQDITARKNAEKAKALIAERNQLLISALGEITYCHNILTDHLEWDGNYRQILGYDAETIGDTGQIWLQRIHPEDKQRAADEIEAAWFEKRPYDLEYRFQKASGDYAWFSDRGILSGEGNELKQILGVMRDVSQRKKLEAIHLQAERKYQQLIETSAEGVWLIDPQGKTTFVNQAMVDMLGYSTTEMLEKTIFNLMAPEDVPSAEVNLERRRQGIKESHDFRFLHKNGHQVWVTIATNPIYDEGGNFAGAMGMLTDITERKQIELMLNVTNRQLNEMITRLEEYNQDFLRLNQLNDFLQACKTIQEAYKILPQFIEALFPHCHGALFRLNQCNDQMEIAIKWGELYTLSTFSRSDCWGLRQSHFHYRGSDYTNVPCEHLLTSSSCVESLCLPLMSDAQQTGLLFLGSSIANTFNAIVVSNKDEASKL